MFITFGDDKTEFMKFISVRGRICILTNMTPGCLTSMTYRLPRTPPSNMSLPCWKSFTDSHWPKLRTCPISVHGYFSFINYSSTYIISSLVISSQSMPHFAFPDTQQAISYSMSFFSQAKNRISTGLEPMSVLFASKFPMPRTLEGT